MRGLKTPSILFALGVCAPVLVFAGQASPAMAILESKYTRAHSLGNDYVFDPRDGWSSVNVTNMDYKYRRQQGSDLNEEFLEGYPGLAKRNHPQKASTRQGLSHAIAGTLSDMLKGLKGVGKSEPVTITWYTGHDLKNPSCWNDGSWAPTDKSFAAALTLEGWVNRPKCFKFLELCNTPKKCVFVRVVDTCAGCAAGSKHVDLTRAAFGQLANFDEGVLKVQFRPATEPERWFKNLWGPKIKAK